MAQHVAIIGIYDNPSFSAPIEYTLDLILSIYGVAYAIMPLNKFKPEEHDLDKILAISYGKEYLNTGAKQQIHIYASDLFNKEYLKPSSIPKTPLGKYQDLPVIYSGRGALDTWVRESKNLVEANIDILASSFFMLSRYEEVVLDAKDEHNRFPATASLAYKEGFLHRPIVNEYIELLWNWIKALKPDLIRRPLWPDAKDIAVCLTHDVDWFRKYSRVPPILNIGYTALRQRNLLLSLSIAANYLKTLFHLHKDPFDTFDYILDMHDRFGFKSSLYFMSGGSSKFDNRYSVVAQQVKRMLKKIEDSGCEVGLHASYNSYNNSEHIISEKAKLDQLLSNKDYGCRQHYVRWKTPDTWRLQEKAGLLYDTTMCFADHIGFRCGICLPYQPFDIVENRKLNIWELPLTAQDSTLQHPNYQNLPPDIAYREIIKQMDTVKRFSGVFVLIWHNSSFDPLGAWAGWKGIYEMVMQYISEQSAFVESGRDIVEWWQTRSPL